jgi:hypothetical protein
MKTAPKQMVRGGRQGSEGKYLDDLKVMIDQIVINGY